jgi:hypothetical protein
VNITLEQYVQLRQKQYRFHCKLLMRGNLDPDEREFILQKIAMGSPLKGCIRFRLDEARHQWFDRGRIDPYPSPLDFMRTTVAD